MRLLLACVLTLASTTPAVAAVPDHVDALLREALAAGLDDEEEAAALALELRALGGSVVPELLRCAAVGAQRPDGGVQPLPPLARAAVVEALGHMPSEVVRAQLFLQAQPSTPLAERASALDVLGTIGSGDDIPLLLALATDTEPGQRPSRVLAERLGRALARLAAREQAELPRHVREALASAHPAHLATLVEALAAPATRAARDELLASFGVRGEADALLLGQVVALVARHGRPADGAYARTAMVALDSPRAATRTQAALLAEALDLVEAVPPLVEAAGSADPLERQAAARALRTLVRVALPADGEAWRRWADEEGAWWREHAQRLLASLERGNDALRALAVRELARARARRDEIVPLVAPLLATGNPDIARLAAQALGELGGREAEDALVDLLAQPDLPALQAGWCAEALRRCTGLELTGDAALWRAMLDVRRR